MTKQIPWGRVFAEGVVIVGSILLAFGIDAWWDRANEEAQEREILGGLEGEFVDLQSRLDQWAGLNRLGVRLSTTVLADPAVEMRRATADSLLLALTLVNVLDKGGGPLDALIASGRLELIQDHAIRARLARWPDRLEDIHTNDLSRRQFALTEIAPFLATHGLPDVFCDLRDLGTPVSLDALVCSGDAALPSAFVTVFGDPQFRALLITMRRLMALSAVGHEEASGEAVEVLHLIRAWLSE
jgi:hypothetical protein